MIEITVRMPIPLLIKVRAREFALFEKLSFRNSRFPVRFRSEARLRAPANAREADVIALRLTNDNAARANGNEGQENPGDFYSVV